MRHFFQVIAVVFAIVMVLNALYDFTRPAWLRASMKHFGFPDRFEQLLGLIKLVGAAGLLVGLAHPAVGVAAAGGFSLYFVLAVATHRRVRDPWSQAAPAALLALVSLVILYSALRTVIS